MTFCNKVNSKYKFMQEYVTVFRFKILRMIPFRPTSYKRPGEQISTTPSGIKITSAKNLMVDSMVRMIQKATNHSVEEKLEEEYNN